MQSVKSAETELDSGMEDELRQLREENARLLEQLRQIEALRTMQSRALRILDDPRRVPPMLDGSTR